MEKAEAIAQRKTDVLALSWLRNVGKSELVMELDPERCQKYWADWRTDRPVSEWKDALIRLMVSGALGETKHEARHRGEQIFNVYHFDRRMVRDA